MMQRKLSPLEYTVLGVIYKKGPCSGYAVLQEFAQSQSAYYRSGAGSIYPLLKRLVDAGLISKSGKLLTLSDVGVRAFRDWFSVEEAGDFATCSLDLLRSRMYFMKVLAPEERQEYIQTALRNLQALLASCEETVRAYADAGDPFSKAAMEGAVEETKARIRWLEKVAIDLSKL